MTNKLAVTAFGDALVDVMARMDADFFARENIAMGSFELVSAEQSEVLYAKMGPAVELSGGSAANTVAVMAGLGVPVGFIGKVKNDQLGAVFTHDIRSVGVAFDVPANESGDPTGRCLIMVAPDGERSMRTSLGCAQDIDPQDIDAGLLMRSDIFYIEGYMWEKAITKQAIVQAIQVSHRAGKRTALTLSDVFVVSRWRDELIELIEAHIDLIFANEHELKALTGLDDFDAGIEWLRERCEIAAITCSEKGAVIISGDDTYIVAAEPVTQVVDATGAGDAYAGGFMAGMAQGKPLDQCGRMGAICASSVISHMGPRPQEDLKALLATKM
jgi:sugar/nucleoside kinase (ribokinase family)